MRTLYLVAIGLLSAPAAAAEWSCFGVFERICVPSRDCAYVPARQVIWTIDTTNKLVRIDGSFPAGAALSEETSIPNPRWEITRWTARYPSLSPRLLLYVDRAAENRAYFVEQGDIETVGYCTRK